MLAFAQHKTHTCSSTQYHLTIAYQHKTHLTILAYQHKTHLASNQHKTHLPILAYQHKTHLQYLLINTKRLLTTQNTSNTICLSTQNAPSYLLINTKRTNNTCLSKRTSASNLAILAYQHKTHLNTILAILTYQHKTHLTSTQNAPSNTYSNTKRIYTCLSTQNASNNTCLSTQNASNNTCLSTQNASNNNTKLI